VDEGGTIAEEAGENSQTRDIIWVIHHLMPLDILSFSLICAIIRV
jgi:hypothetical protein